MKLDPGWARDRYGQYCLYCRQEGIRRVIDGGRAFHDCTACGRRSGRAIVIDPGIRWWVDSDGEYWHESAGVFIRRPDGRFLFFSRTMFPFAVTVPAGHVDTGEEPSVAAVREVSEEVGLDVGRCLVPIGSDAIAGDSCSRGADAHRWHTYLAPVGAGIAAQVIEEGEDPVWLSLDEATDRDLTVPVRYILDRYRGALLNAATASTPDPDGGGLLRSSG